MLTLISPAKKLNLNQDNYNNKLKTSLPSFLIDSLELTKILKQQSASDLKKLMNISDNIAELNYQRYQSFSAEKFTKEIAHPALFMFAGEVYNGLDAKNFSLEEISFANENLRILSGLYGILKPLDLVQPYRLEMGTALKNSRGKNLYQFWQEKITNYLNEQKVILNLASNEYFSVLDKKKLTAKIITPVFKDYKNGSLKVIMMYAKKARGEMANFFIKNKIKDWIYLKECNINNYRFEYSLSETDSSNNILLTFIR